MKNILIGMLLVAIAASCSNNSENKTEAKKLSDIEQIANAYGINNFDKIKRLTYTFNVDRDNKILVSRTWIWNRESGEITMMSSQDTVLFKQDALDEELKKIDHRFINDKYWLLFPYQLVWDSSMTYTNMGKEEAPISGKQMTKLIIQYGSEGGYTPGDAYDLYLDDNWIIREWEFRKSGKESPGSAITWEGYTETNGIKIATEHLDKDGSLRIYFTNIKIE